MGRLLCLLGFHRTGTKERHNVVGCRRCPVLVFATCPTDCPDCHWERAEAERRLADEVS